MNTSLPKLAGLLVAALIGIGPPASGIAADKADTTRSMTRLSAKAADEKAKRDLLSILQPTGKFTQGNRARVSGMAMDTVPYGAGFKGLCRRDELFLVYGSTATGPNGADDPLRPMGIEAERQFRVAKGPVTGVGDAFAQQAAWNDADCRKLQSDKSAPWFTAADAREAARGANVLLAATKAIESGRLKLENCNMRQADTTCEKWVVQRVQVNQMIEVKSDYAAAANQKCYILHFTEPLELTAIASFADDETLVPSKIDSVSVAEYIVVT